MGNDLTFFLAGFYFQVPCSIAGGVPITLESGHSISLGNLQRPTRRLVSE